MAVHGVIRRYALIIEKVSKDHFPTFQRIQEFLIRNRLEISSRTFQRDLQHIRYEFSIEICFDRAQHGYYIEKDSSFGLDLFLRFVSSLNHAELIKDCLKEGKKALKHIVFDSAEVSGGTDFLAQLLPAIKNRRIVTFTHESFYHGGSKKHSLRPFLLKEYQGRWYLIGNFSPGQKWYSYGLDRIKDLQITTQTFEPGNEPDPNSFFSSIIGMTHPDGKPEEIVLSVVPEQMKYLNTVPLHRSQKVISETKKETLISLKVVSNPELIQRILMLRENITVLKPSSLVNEIKKALATALQNYR